MTTKSKKIELQSGKNRLNKFERTRLLSARALELEKGAPAKVDISLFKKPLLSKDYIKIAEKELEEGVLELEIV